MSVRAIAIAEHFDAALPLMQANWRETGCDFPFEPSRDFFVAGEAAGLIYAMGAFHGEELVGYASGIVAPHPFNPQVRVASNNVLYVLPQYRAGTLPGRLMVGVREEAKRREAQYLFWHMRSGTKAGDMLADHGCECVDNVWMEGL